MADEDDNLVVRSLPGDRRVIEYAVDSDGKTMPAKVFITTELPVDLQTEVYAKFRHLAENGEAAFAGGVFCQEKKEIWTLKCKFLRRCIRIPCFRHQNRWIATHGFIKPGQSKWPKAQFKEANRLRDIFLASEAEKQSARNTK